MFIQNVAKGRTLLPPKYFNLVSCYFSAYMSVFKPIIQQVLEYYRPTVIVLQVSTVDNLCMSNKTFSC